MEYYYEQRTSGITGRRDAATLNMLFSKIIQGAEGYRQHRTCLNEEFLKLQQEVRQGDVFVTDGRLPTEVEANRFSQLRSLPTRQ
jgi:hypothetical protein